MATADFEFGITYRGTQEQMLTLLDIIRKYDNGTGDIYLSFTNLVVKNKRCVLGINKDEEILAAIAESDGEISFSATGPYGRFSDLSEIDIFRCIAEATPDASFDGTIEGFTSYTEEKLACELKNGILYTDTSFMANEDYSDAYFDYFTELLPHEDFTDMFELDPDVFDEDAYNIFVADTLCDDICLDDLDYEDFYEEIFSACGLEDLDVPTPERYEAGLEAYRELGIQSFDDFLDNADDLFDKNHYEYDPVAKEYVTGSSRPFPSGVIEINDQIREYLSAKGLPCTDEDIDALSVEDVYAILAGTYGVSEAVSEEPGETPLEEAEEEFAAVEDAPAEIAEIADAVEEGTAESAENGAAVEEISAGASEEIVPAEKPATEPAEEAVPAEETVSEEMDEAFSAEENSEEEPAAEATVTAVPAQEPVEDSVAAVPAEKSPAEAKSSKAWIAWLIIVLLAAVAISGYFFCPFLYRIFNAAADFVRGLFA